MLWCTLLHIYFQQYRYCLSCTVLCYLPHSLKGRGSYLLPILLILVFVLPVILLVYLVGCPSYLQSLVLTLLPCNFFFLGCTHVPTTQVFVPVVVTSLAYVRKIIIHCVWLQHHSVTKCSILVHLYLGPKQTNINYILIDPLTKLYFEYYIYF